ncbi:MYG1 family protein [Proteinivorax hydrogeniformans]|uniref:MYG1 family protein n=1 Tax=Proteinivorax hydrogeniformans TaxID=1826727 RepID=A0AAU8HT81_9FIRM
MIKINTKPYKKVGTHDGRFHADELMATAILQQIFDIEVVRTRDPDTLEKLDIVYDVGGGKFDHHGEDKEYRSDEIPYAASGLIWREYGYEVIRAFDGSLTKEEIQSAHQHVDKVLITGIDALDNGIRPENETFRLMNISAMLSGFNPPWYSAESEDAAFYNGVRVCSQVLKNTISQSFGVLKGRDEVINAFTRRENPNILVLDVNCPWQETIIDIDEEEEVMLAIYPDNNRYALQTVRGKDKKDRMQLPRKWAGKENQELANLSGVSDAIFCHTGLFFAASKTLKGAKELAQKALQNAK